MKRSAWGLSAMSVSLMLGTIIAVGSLIAMRGQLNTEMLTRQPFNIPTMLVSCLDPLTILLEILAIILIVRDSRQFGALHHRLAWTAAILYIVWAAANIFGFLPLSFLSLRNGSLSLALAGQWLKAISALLAFSVPALLVFGFSPKALRVGLGLGLLLNAIGSFGTVALTITHFQLQPITVAGQTLHVAKLSVDYTTGAYPTLLVTGYVGGMFYLTVYAYLTWQTWLRVRTSSA